MDKVTSVTSVLTVSLILVVGVAASYPDWSQWAGQAQGFGSTPQPDANSTTTSNFTTLAPPSVSSTLAYTTYQTTTTTLADTTAVPFGPAWVSQFLGVVDTYRGSESLTDCPRLDSFAMTRFHTMTNGTNWEVVHYGYSQDLHLAFGGSSGNFGEDLFFPTNPPYSPQNFATLVRTQAPAHWSDLTNAGYAYYGAYFAGQGPVLLFNNKCAPQELTAGENVTIAFPGCPYQKVPGTWLVIELASDCPK